MAISEEDLKEFLIEAGELLDESEKSLLSLEQGAELKLFYDSIFRVFHSLKGAASMMEMAPLQNHLHQLETLLTEQKQELHLSKPHIDLFLRGTDAARILLSGGKIDFVYSVSSETKSESGASVETTAQKAAVKKPSPLGRAIVVDDEPEIVSILTTVLTNENYEVLGFTDPGLVCAQIEAYKPDVIFTDISMPKITGIQLLNDIKKKYPDLPVVFISGEVSKKSLLEAIALGVHGVLEKPFKIGEVIQICGQAVRQYQAAKLITSSINLLMYQFSDLDNFLLKQGKHDVRNLIRTEIIQLIEQRRRLRSHLL